MRSTLRGVLLAVLAFSAALADPVAITNAVLHPVSGPPIPGGTLLMARGRILAVGPGPSVEVPGTAVVVDAGGLHLWPGLVDGLSQIGLLEISSVLGTRDHTESGQINPNARAEVAVNASSSHIEVTRANGTLLAVTVPYGSLVPGTAALLALDGWTWEEMVRRAPVGLVIEWPAMGPGPRSAWEEDEKKEDIPPWEERIARLDEMIEEARAYARAAGSEPAVRDPDVRWESLLPVVSGEVPVWIHAGNLTQIRSALDWTQRHELSLVLVDGSGATGGDAWRVAEELAERDVPVVVQTTRLPARVYEPYDTAFSAPAVLQAAGVRILFGSWNAAHARDLPQEAARAVAFGLPRRAAERALTLEACEALGVDGLYGSLERGKSATMILVEGDLLDIRMRVARAWVDGEEISLESRHTRLREKWSARPLPAGAPSVPEQ